MTDSSRIPAVAGIPVSGGRSFLLSLDTVAVRRKLLTAQEERLICFRKNGNFAKLETLLKQPAVGLPVGKTKNIMMATFLG